MLHSNGLDSFQNVSVDPFVYIQNWHGVECRLSRDAIVPNRLEKLEIDDAGNSQDTIVLYRLKMYMMSLVEYESGQTRRGQDAIVLHWPVSR